MNTKTKKQFLLAMLLVVSTVSFAQVGIDTTDPKATLDVNGDATSTSADGIMSPRVTLANLLAKDAATYDSDQTSAIVYVTDATGTPSGETINITRPGYYFFDGTVWQPFTAGFNQFITMQKSTNQAISQDSPVKRVTFDATPIANFGTDITWNGSDTITINNTGVYAITVQIGIINSITNSTDGTYILGVIDSSNTWIGRATFGNPNASHRTYKVYTITINLSAGDEIGIGFYTTNDNGGTLQVQGIQTGSTGSGIVTNFSISRKI